LTSPITASLVLVLVRDLRFTPAPPSCCVDSFFRSATAVVGVPDLRQGRRSRREQAPDADEGQGHPWERQGWVPHPQFWLSGRSTAHQALPRAPRSTDLVWLIYCSNSRSCGVNVLRRPAINRRGGGGWQRV